MFLAVEGGRTTLPIGQMGPDFVILDDPIDHPPSDALLVWSIDGEERRREIRLPEGLAGSKRRTPIAAP